MAVFTGGKQVASLYPAKWFFHKHEDEPPTTEVGIRRTIAEDLYIVLAAADAATQAASLKITVNPLVNWVWMGFGILALGTGIALLPERSFSFALSKLPATDAVTTTAAVLLALFLGSTALSAQHGSGSAETVPVVPRTALEKQLQGEIICMCGGCGRQLLNACACPLAAQMRTELAGLVNSGKSHEDVIQYYIAKYGSQEPLAAPIDKGFNRLAWLFPYAVGSLGAVVGAVVLVKWSRHPKAERPLPPSPVEDASLQARIDQELDNLD
jgi:cytochrome c-type biogenesis protein CcmF